MTCTLVGVILSCLISPAPKPEDVAVQLAAFQYVSVVQPDGLHVYIMAARPTPPSHCPEMEPALPYLDSFYGGYGYPYRGSLQWRLRPYGAYGERWWSGRGERRRRHED